MNRAEISDLEDHLVRKIGADIGDVLQLVDDPRQQAMILSVTMTVIFDAAVNMIREAYEADTGGKANINGIMHLLLKECVDHTKARARRETRASKPRKPAARSS
jgi:hypothetical protein